MRFPGLIAVLFGLEATSVEVAELASPAPADPGAAVFKLSALDGSGKVKACSAVLIAPGKLLTTCHVTREAESIQVHRDHARLTAKPDFIDIEHDLCVLSAPDLLGSVPAEVAMAGDLKVGDEVLAVGHPRGGKIALSKGRLKAMRHYGAVRVLQVSALFDHGQSGGALFDDTGRLVGITAFKTMSGGDFHFALEFDRIDREDVPTISRPTVVPDSVGHKTAFRERARNTQPLFLRAVALHDR